MKYRKFIIGESLGMIFSSFIILAGLAIFGEDNTYPEPPQTSDFAATTVSHNTPLSVRISNNPVSLDHAGQLPTEADEISVLL